MSTRSGRPLSVSAEIDRVAPPWVLPRSSPTVPLPPPSWIGSRISPQPRIIATELSSRNLVAWDQPDQPIELLENAGRWVGLERTLAAIIAEVVHNIHLLRAPPGYDVSHSEPRWPSRIFVSIPERSDDVGGLRLAESIIHEAMHLHLTNQEHAAPLVIEFTRLIKSPWRAEPRSYQGVLHGLFVFTCLITYFRRISKRFMSDASANHRERRIAEIKDEILSLEIARLCAGLTAKGAVLAGKWYDTAVSAH